MLEYFKMSFFVQSGQAHAEPIKMKLFELEFLVRNSETHLERDREMSAFA
jgi:hypothetical protein